MNRMMTITANGYLADKAPDHPRAWKKGYVYQHVLVAEAALGRYIKPNEVVHHINGDKRDNRPDNLRVMKRSDHTHSHAPPVTMVQLTCSYCTATFDREKRQMKIGKLPYCSNSCRAKAHPKKRTAQHGSTSMYGYWCCRCDVCKEGHRSRARSSTGRASEFESEG